MYLVMPPLGDGYENVPIAFWNMVDLERWRGLPHLRTSSVTPDDKSQVVQVGPGEHPIAATIRAWVKDRHLGYRPLMAVLARWKIVLRDAVLCTHYGPEARTREMLDALQRTGHTWAVRAFEDAMRASDGRTPEIAACEWATKAVDHLWAAYRLHRRHALRDILAWWSPFMRHPKYGLCIGIDVGAPVLFKRIEAKIGDPLTVDGIWEMPLEQKLEVLWRWVAPELWAALEIDRRCLGWPDELEPNIMSHRLIRSVPDSAEDIVAIASGRKNRSLQPEGSREYGRLVETYVRVTSAAFAAWKS